MTMPLPMRDALRTVARQSAYGTVINNRYKYTGSGITYRPTRLTSASPIAIPARILNDRRKFEFDRLEQPKLTIEQNLYLLLQQKIPNG